MTNIALFASGNGTNAENIIRYFQNSKENKVRLVLTNNPDAFVLERIKPFNIDPFVFSGKELRSTEIVLNKLKEFRIDFIVLAGFLLMVPDNILDSYPNKIINIHPALLPKYGGKGMYGMNVHQAVINSKEKESGITIHYVNSNYDEGTIIFQTKCIINPGDTPETLAHKIHQLEQTHFPNIVEKVISNLK